MIGFTKNLKEENSRLKGEVRRLEYQITALQHALENVKIKFSNPRDFMDMSNILSENVRMRSLLEEAEEQSLELIGIKSQMADQHNIVKDLLAANKQMKAAYDNPDLLLEHIFTLVDREDQNVAERMQPRPKN